MPSPDFSYAKEALTHEQREMLDKTDLAEMEDEPPRHQQVVVGPYLRVQDQMVNVLDPKVREAARNLIDTAENEGQSALDILNLTPLLAVALYELNTPRALRYERISNLDDEGVEAAFEEALAEVDGGYYDPFADIARELIEIHDRKGKDYGSSTDPYTNVRMSEGFGIPAWIGVGVRMNDKMKRLQTASQQYLESGQVRLQHEGLLDIANDFAVYGIILRIMIQEWIAEGNQDLSEGRL